MKLLASDRCLLNTCAAKDMLDCKLYTKIQVGNDQEKAQSEKDSHSKNRSRKKTN